MGLFDRIRGVFTKPEVCPPEHLEGYRRIGDEVYAAKVELANETNPRVKLLVRITEVFQTMGNALLNDVLSDRAGASADVPEITHEQAETWYGHIPDLLIAARQEAIYPGSSQVLLPVQIGSPAESEQMCPLSHLAGLRRAASEMENLVAGDMVRVRLEKNAYRETLLLYEEARTRRSTADALVGSIMGGQQVPHETHEDAREQYWHALAGYLLVVQGVEDNTMLANLLWPKSKLDSDDVWKVTAGLAVDDLRETDEFEGIQEALEAFWSTHEITDEERRYENAIENLLEKGIIRENGYWYKLPYQPVYVVTAARVEIHRQRIARGQEFVWDYSNHGEGQGFLTRSAFRYAEERSH